MKRWLIPLSVALALAVLIGAVAEDAAEDVEATQVEAPSEEEPTFDLGGDVPEVGEGLDGGVAAPETTPEPPAEETPGTKKTLKLQGWLITLNYLSADGLTGEYDDATRIAVADFQRANGLTPTGDCNTITWKLIEEAARQKAAASPSPSPAPASTEKEIKEIQQTLIALKYLDETGATGVMDEATTAAIAQFQSEHELPSTGVCDAETLAALKNAAGGGAKVPSSRGGRGSASPTPTPDPRLHGVTPGTALKTGHERGNKDASAYGAIDPKKDAEAMNVTLYTGADDASLEEADFTVEVSDAEVTFAADEGAVQWWLFDGATLRSLNRGGIASVTFTGGGGELTLSTADRFAGPVYAALRSGGYTDNTYIYFVAVADGAATVDVYVDGTPYRATPADDGTWTLALEAET